MKIGKITFFVVFIITLTFVSFPSDAFACACCAEPGTYLISTKKPAKYELDELKKIRFAGANLFMTAAGENSIFGIASTSENYSITGAFQSSVWQLNFKDDTGKTGTLNLPMPASMLAFAADIHDRKKQKSEPLLYKEVRFKHKVASGTGIFKNGITPATEYFLVLQGRGNNCMNAADFTNWRLEITGRRAKYAFFGELKSKS